MLATQVLDVRPCRMGNGVTRPPQDDPCRRAWQPVISKRDKAIRSCCCTAASSAQARNSAGSATSPRWPRITVCWRPTCWGSGSRRRSSTSTTAVACESGTSRGSARRWASTSAHFVGNSMGAVNMFVDATSESPLLPMRSMVDDLRRRRDPAQRVFGRPLRLRRHSGRDARASSRRCSSTRRILPTTTYVQRRYESSIAPGAWEALAAARFRGRDSNRRRCRRATGIRPHHRANAGGGR